MRALDSIPACRVSTMSPEANRRKVYKRSRQPGGDSAPPVSAAGPGRPYSERDTRLSRSEYRTPRKRNKPSPKLAQAQAWLRQRLKDGPAPIADVIEDAKLAGVKRTTLYLAAKAERVESCVVKGYRRGIPWYQNELNAWSLPNGGGEKR